MPKWVKMIVAILLLPICVGAAQALWLVIQHRSGGYDMDSEGLPLVMGCWIVIFSLPAETMWIYVLGHWN